MMFIEAKTSYPLPFIFYRGLQLRYCGLLIFSLACLLDRSELPLPLSELFICWMSRSIFKQLSHFFKSDLHQKVVYALLKESSYATGHRLHASELSPRGCLT